MSGLSTKPLIELNKAMGALPYVFPVNGKAPVNGFKWKDHAQNNPYWWERWAREYSDMTGWGLPTGQKNNLVVIDIDKHEGKADGAETLRELELVLGALPTTVTVVTGGGGTHYYYKCSVKLPSRPGIAPGIDVKGEGGYVLMPPSKHPSGGVYEWELCLAPDEQEIAELPEAWVIFILQKTDGAASKDHALSQKQKDPRKKPGIVGAFCRTYTITEVIAEYLPEVYTPFKWNRYTYKNGSGTGGLVVYDGDIFAYSNHSTDPAREKLCNAFDLARRHLFGELDTGIPSDTAPDQLPSYKAMCKRALEDPKVKAQIEEDKKADFESLEASAPAEPDPVEWREMNEGGGEYVYYNADGTPYAKHITPGNIWRKYNPAKKEFRNPSDIRLKPLFNLHYIAGATGKRVYVTLSEAEAYALQSCTVCPVTYNPEAWNEERKRELTSRFEEIIVPYAGLNTETQRGALSAIGEALGYARSTVYPIDVNELEFTLKDLETGELSTRRGGFKSLAEWAEVTPARDIENRLNELLAMSSPYEPEHIEVRDLPTESAERSVSWLWYPYIPLREISVLYADSGTGKSSLVASIIADVIRGKALPNDKKREFKNRKVLYITGEDNKSAMVAKLLAVGVSEDLINTYLWAIGNEKARRKESERITLDSDRLEGILNQWNPVLVVLDPWTSFTPEGFQPNSSADVRRVLEPLAGKMGELNASLLLVAHISKKEQTDVRNASSGSKELQNLARSYFTFLTPDRWKEGNLEPEERLLLHTKYNHSEEGRALIYKMQKEENTSKNAEELEVYAKYVREEPRITYPTYNEYLARELLHLKRTVFDVEETPEDYLDLVEVLKHNLPAEEGRESEKIRLIDLDTAGDGEIYHRNTPKSVFQMIRGLCAAEGFEIIEKDLLGKPMKVGKEPAITLRRFKTDPEESEGFDF